jgi:hypothetical protein
MRAPKDDIVFPGIPFLLLIIILVWVLTSCRFQRDLQKSTEKTTTTTTETTTGSKVDTSKSTKDASYERVTYLYPPGDTTIINNYYTQGKQPPPTTVIVERGESKEVAQSFNYEQWWKHKQDSLAQVSITKDVKSDTKVGPSTFEIILGVSVLLMFGYLILKKKPV